MVALVFHFGTFEKNSIFGGQPPGRGPTNFLLGQWICIGTWGNVLGSLENHRNNRLKWRKRLKIRWNRAISIFGVKITKFEPKNCFCHQMAYASVVKCPDILIPKVSSYPPDLPFSWTRLMVGQKSQRYACLNRRRCPENLSFGPLFVEEKIFPSDFLKNSYGFFAALGINL